MKLEPFEIIHAGRKVTVWGKQVNLDAFPSVEFFIFQAVDIHGLQSKRLGWSIAEKKSGWLLPNDKRKLNFKTKPTALLEVGRALLQFKAKNPTLDFSMAIEQALAKNSERGIIIGA